MRIPIQQELSPHHDRRRVVRIKPQNLQRFTIVVEVVHDHSLDRTTDNPRPRRSKPRKTQILRRVSLVRPYLRARRFPVVGSDSRTRRFGHAQGHLLPRPHAGRLHQG
ncbi:hypothetical protein ACFPRL_03290 [Pseudoclavibacter helvolus]